MAWAWLERLLFPSTPVRGRLPAGAADAQNVLLLGLDNAGKSSLVARLCGEEVRTLMPTRGFAIRSIKLSGGGVISLWDVGGRHDVRVYWNAYYGKVESLIFVIDATDRRRMEEASEVLIRLLDDASLAGKVGAPARARAGWPAR